MVKISNPIIWADVPDNDVIRVGDAFYMVSTSMHSTPGGPIMKSYDLQHWEIVSYIFETLNDKDGNNLENGCSIYGQGSWAASLRYVDGWYYCLFNCNDDHCAYMFRTRDIEASNWEKHRLSRFLHDPGLLIDDDGRKYVLYGNNDIYIVELTEDMLDFKPGGLDRLLFTTEQENIGLKAEGCHAYKIAGTYYAIFIEWPTDGHARRREVCYRWTDFNGPVEHRVILDDDMRYHNAGIAQGAIFTLPGGGADVDASQQTGSGDADAGLRAVRGLKSSLGEYVMSPGPDGALWAALLFQDHGAVGRIPYVMPVEWRDGWPMPGIDGYVPEWVELPIEARTESDSLSESLHAEGRIFTREDLHRGEPDPYSESAVAGNHMQPGYGLVASDDFRRIRGQETCLADVRHLWQWNHNPDNVAWSLTEREGWLRLVNLHLTERGILAARNTLTQRTFGPHCTFATHLEFASLKNGDAAGMVAMQGQFGLVGVRAGEEGERTLVMCVNDGKYGEKVIASEKLAPGRSDIYLKIEFDFEDNRDLAVFYRSFDGSRWKQVGRPLAMKYTLDHFMGYRVGLYSYATEQTGGYADFEWFRVE